MADFNKSFEFLDKLERGYVDHPDDPGGATNGGISLRWYRRAVNAAATPETIKALDKEIRRELYRDHWWNGRLYYAINSQDLADRYFALSVNVGESTATRIVQRALNALLKNDTLRIDGVFGLRTLDVLNTIYPVYVIQEVRDQTLKYYDRLIITKPALAAFKNGWRKRALA